MAKLPRLAWDSSCFLAWVDRKETEDLDILKALNVTMDQALAGRIQLVASQAIETEVRPGDLERTWEFHLQLKACPFFESFPEGPAIRRLAREMQDRLHASGRRGQYAYLIHTATAAAARAQTLWTTDKKMVRCHTEGPIKEIRICLPFLDQGVLDLE